MPWLLNFAYLFVLGVLSPWLVWRAVCTGRYRKDLLPKLSGRVSVPDCTGRRVVWFHAVSVGEVHLLGPLVAAFRRRHPAWVVVVSSTTDTGLSEARTRFADGTVVPFPFDFSWAVGTALDRIRPSLLVLVEGEMWPNLLRAARRRGVAVAVVNARLSPRSFRRYARVSALARAFLFRYVDRIAVQSEEYADRFRALGVEASKLVATGSVKYDGAVGNRDSEKAGQLRGLLFGREPKPGEILVAGSTHAPEEAIVLRTFRRLRARFPALRLILVPRHPDRFEEVARLVESTGFAFVRRSQIEAALVDCPPVILLDSVGELGAAWALADIGYVGGTLDGRRGGQSMIEPAGYGVPTVFGPHVWNFRDAAARLVEAGGAVMVKVETELDGVLARLITDKDERTAMGTAARDLVRRQQGATERTLDVLHGLMGESVLLPRAG